MHTRVRRTAGRQGGDKAEFVFKKGQMTGNGHTSPNSIPAVYCS